MNILLFCYDLMAVDSYKAFYDKLEDYDHCWAMDNHCLISANESAERVRANLLPHVSGNDGVLVCNFSGDWSGISVEAEIWLDSHRG